MPYYPGVRPTQQEKNLLIRVGSHTYRLTAQTSSFSTMIYLGGHTTHCITCQVIPSDPTGNLVKIAYDELCSLSGIFERGSGIKQLLAVLLSYLQKYHPHVTALSFTDASSRDCGLKHRIQLASFYYLLYGKTWYMQNMAAVFASSVDAARFQQADTAFQARKATMSWEDFDARIAAPDPLSKEIMKELYNTSSTWFAFFQSLRDKIGTANLCEYMAYWIDPFMTSVVRFSFPSYSFLLPVPNPSIPAVSFTDEPYQMGGKKRRQTRRYRWRATTIM
jgi:hypothetical protein